MTQQKPKLTFRVDMNSLRGNEIGTLLRHATNPAMACFFPPEPGDLVEVLDEDEIQYQAVVQEVVDGWLGVSIEWESKTVAPPRSSLSYGQSTFDLTPNVKVA